MRVRSQVVALSSSLHRGKPADADAFGDRRYDSVQPTPPPPPLPAQYSQPPQPSAGSSLHAHAKGAHGEGRTAEVAAPLAESNSHKMKVSLLST